jgi:hypothetical protein
MTRSAFIHIGTHKTGSSYLQRWLFSNRKGLAPLGLHYAASGIVRTDLSHKWLHRTVFEQGGTPFEPSRPWRTLAHELDRRTGDVILSCELMSGLTNAKKIQRIADFFTQRGLEPVFVIFFRDVAAYFNSRYAQDTKNLRVTEGFRPYVERRYEDRAYNYVEVLSPFAAAARVLALPYAPGVTPLEVQFLQGLGRPAQAIDAQAWTPVGRVNESLSAEALNLARRIAAQLPEAETRHGLPRRREMFKSACRSKLTAGTPFIGCDAAYAEALRARFSDITDAIAETYFDRPWADAVPPDPRFEAYDAQAQAREAPQDVQDSIMQEVLHPPVTAGLRELWASVRRRVRYTMAS